MVEQTGEKRQNSFVYSIIVSTPATSGGLIDHTSLMSDIMKLLGNFKMLGDKHDHNAQMSCTQVIQGQ